MKQLCTNTNRDMPLANAKVFWALKSPIRYQQIFHVCVLAISENVLYSPCFMDVNWQYPVHINILLRHMTDNRLVSIRCHSSEISSRLLSAKCGVVCVIIECHSHSP